MSAVTGIPSMIDTPEDFELVLDPGIRAFVLIPIFLVVFLRSLLSQNVAKLVKKKPEQKATDRIQHAQVIRRSKRIRGNCNWIPPQSFAQRKKYLINHSLAPIEVEKKEPGEQSAE
eukprot:184697_1